MRTLLLSIAISSVFGSSSRPTVQLGLAFDIEGISRRGTSVGADAEPVILNGVDLNSLSLIERSGRYYVTIRDEIPVDAPEILHLALIRFQERHAPLVIGFDANIRPMPAYTVGFLEGIFRHLSGLPLNENPSPQEVPFVSFGPQAIERADPTFGMLPVGLVTMDSIRSSLVSSDLTVPSLFRSGAPPLILINLRKVSIVTRVDWLLDPSHTRYVFSRYAIQGPSVSDLEQAMSFVFIDAGVWNGGAETVPILLSALEATMANPEGFMSMMRIIATKPRLAVFMTGFDGFLLGHSSNTNFMGLIKRINRAVGDSSSTRIFYEIVLRD